MKNLCAQQKFYSMTVDLAQYYCIYMCMLTEYISVFVVYSLCQIFKNNFTVAYITFLAPRPNSK